MNEIFLHCYKTNRSKSYNNAERSHRIEDRRLHCYKNAISVFVPTRSPMDSFVRFPNQQTYHVFSGLSLVSISEQIYCLVYEQTHGRFSNAQQLHIITNINIKIYLISTQTQQHNQLCLLHNRRELNPTPSIA